MKGNRFIIHNPSIENYQLEDLHHYHKKLVAIDKEKISIYKTIEQQRLESSQRFSMLQLASKYNKQEQQNAQEKLLKILDDKIERIKIRENPYMNRIRCISSFDIKTPTLTFNHSLENLNLMKKLQTLKPNISKKDLDIHYKKQQEYGNRLRKLPKIIDRKISLSQI